jgi:hypothetical protein
VLGWLLVAGLFAAQLWLFGNFSIDDAFISFRFVRQFVAGNGLVFNVGERVEGYSNYLWVMALAPLHAAGIDLLVGARALNVALAAGTLVLTYRLARAYRYPIVAPLLLAACPPFAAWTMGGLETILFAFLLVAGALTFAREEESGAGWSSGLVFALLAMTRPEGALFAGVAFAIRAVRLWLRRAWPTHDDALRIVSFAALFGTYFLWRLSYYGDPLPNTVYAKSMGLHPRALIEGAYYVYVSFIAIGGPWFLAVPIAFVAVNGRTVRNLILLAFVTAYGLAILAGGGDWMPMQRLLVHCLPLLAVLSHAGLILATSGLASRWQPVAVLALVLVQTGYLVFGAFDAHFVQGVGRAVEPTGPTASDVLRERLRPGDSVALTDAGGLGYASPLQARVIDMFGLTDRHIARLPPQFPGGLFGQGDGFGKWDVDYVLAQNPRFIQVHVTGQAPDGTFIVDNTSNRLLVSDPRFTLRYRQVGSTPELQGLFERRDN